MVLGNADFVQAFLVGKPGVGQVQLQVQGVVAVWADVVDGDGDLTVGLRAQSTAVLPLNANGVRAPFGERDIVEQEDPIGTGERLGEVGAVASEDDEVVPGALVDELLECLLGIGAGEPVGQRDAA